MILAVGLSLWFKTISAVVEQVTSWAGVRNPVRLDHKCRCFEINFYFSIICEFTESAEYHATLRHVDVIVHYNRRQVAHVVRDVLFLNCGCTG